MSDIGVGYYIYFSIIALGLVYYFLGARGVYGRSALANFLRGMLFRAQRECPNCHQMMDYDLDLCQRCKYGE